ncbi:hypothetical protein [Kibdelosporangium persicum]|uniref:hypothetical protein n=1 Tax=Kibdelosporangium persicum TaxID=2698649 RepID=UPI001563D2C1|nr:hypothetical protein [Kibdelosporangium persicum]
MSRAAVVTAGWQVIQRRWRDAVSGFALLVAGLTAPAVAMLVAWPFAAIADWLLVYGLALLSLLALLVFERWNWGRGVAWWDLTPAINDRWPAQRAVLMVLALVVVRLLGWRSGWIPPITVAVAAYTFLPWIQMIVRRFTLPLSAHLHRVRAPASWPNLPADLLLWQLFLLEVHAELVSRPGRHSLDTARYLASVVRPSRGLFFDPPALTPLGARRCLARQLEVTARWCETEWVASGRHLVPDTACLAPLAELGRRVAGSLRSVRDMTVLDDGEAIAGEATTRLRTLLIACATGNLQTVTANAESTTAPQRARQLIARFTPSALLLAAAVLVPVLLKLTDTQATPVRVALILAAVLSLVRADRSTTDLILQQTRPREKS